ncbi:MAG: SDR family oxidoreductase [Desulfobacterales bacterium]|nr:SDR family oxidoreductase [Desulfobacterales bacterium]
MEKENGRDPISNFRLDGRVAVVTGSGQGLGKWIALGLAEAGAAVLVADVNPKSATSTAQEIMRKGGRSVSMEVDVGDIDAVSRMMELAVEELGGLDILVNNAGINVHKRALDIEPNEFERILRVNSRGVYFCCQEAAKRMIPRKRGKIINIASAAAFLVRAGVPNSVYAMTKAGIVMLTKALAEEWSDDNILVNAVAPGYFATPLVSDRLGDPDAYARIVGSTPLKRVGRAEDIVGAIIFFASDASNFITGQTLSIDGGRTIL